MFLSEKIWIICLDNKVESKIVFDRYGPFKFTLTSGEFTLHGRFEM